MHIDVGVQNAFTKFGDREIPEVREFIDNFPITPTITKETVLTGNEWVYHVTVSNTISIFRTK